MQAAVSRSQGRTAFVAPTSCSGARCSSRTSAYATVNRLELKTQRMLSKVPRLARVAAALAEAEVTEEMSAEELKAALLDSFYGVERGLAADSDTRAEINELISQLEGKNPTPLPNEAAGALDGTWRLVYASNSLVNSLLALASRLPLLEVGEITQTIDSAAATVENRVELSAPLSRTSLSTSASYEVRSPKLLQLRLEGGVVATPELLDDLQLPDSISLLGQSVDLQPLQAALRPLDGPVRGLVAGLGSALAGAPDLRFPISGPKASTWLLNTYVDEDLRITRGDRGSVYVSVRQQRKVPVSPAPAVDAAIPVVEAAEVIEEVEEVAEVVPDADATAGSDGSGAGGAP